MLREGEPRSKVTRINVDRDKTPLTPYLRKEPTVYPLKKVSANVAQVERFNNTTRPGEKLTSITFVSLKID